jgi:hypothetical protein
VDQWFAEHPDYLTNPFYVGGASRAGKIAPFVAQKISEGGVVLLLHLLVKGACNWMIVYSYFNTMLFPDIEAGMTPRFNLKVLIFLKNIHSVKRMDAGNNLTTKTLK